jgi:hypothetical protein
MTGTCAPWAAKAAWQANVLALTACSSRVAWYSRAGAARHPPVLTLSSVLSSVARAPAGVAEPLEAALGQQLVSVSGCR